MNKFISVTLLFFSSYCLFAGHDFTPEQWNIIKTTAKKTQPFLQAPLNVPEENTKYQGSKGAAEHFFVITELARSYFDLLTVEKIPKKAQREIVVGMCAWSFAALSGLYLYSTNEGEALSQGLDGKNCSNIDCGKDRQGNPFTAFVCETGMESYPLRKKFNILGTDQSVFCVYHKDVDFQENKLGALEMNHCGFVEKFDRDFVPTDNNMFPSYFYPALSASFNVSCQNDDVPEGMNLSKTIERCLPWAAASALIYPAACVKSWVTASNLNKKYALEIKEVKKRFGEEVTEYRKKYSTDKKFFQELLNAWVEVIDPS